MQWGDLSFQSDVIGDYVSEKASNNFISLRIPRLGLTEKKTFTAIDSRFTTIRTLSEIYAREKTT